MAFSLHHRLAADTVEICDFTLCRVLLMNDASWPWLILVPRRPGLREFDDVAEGDRADLMAEIARASDALRHIARPDKLNVAAIGNVVDQLHIHIVARFGSDPAWPAPVWGFAEPVRYDEAALAERVSRLRADLE